MRKITKTLSSTSLAVWILALLVFWSCFGIVLAVNPIFTGRFRDMNNFVLIDWLKSPQSSCLTLKIWVIGLCFMMFVLGINLVFCSWLRFFRLIRIKRADMAKYIMFFVHILFGLAAVAHFLGFVSGYKYENIRLSPDKSFNFSKGLSVKLLNIHYVDKPSSLMLSHGEQTSENFHYRSNYAEMEILNYGRVIYIGRAFVLRPIRFGAIQITLKKFISSESLAHTGQKKKILKDGKALRKGTIVGDKANRASKGISIMIIISKNTALYAFFVIYPLMIAGIAVYLVITWKRHAL